MSDTKELRRLAQAATPGRWYVERGNYVYGCKEVTDGEEEWHPVIACTDDDEVSINFEGNAKFIAAANPAAITELLDRLEVTEGDIILKERVIDSLGSTLNAVAKERDALRAKVEAMEKQEPVATVRINAINGNPSVDFVPGHRYLHHNDKLYLAPGARGE